MCTSQKIDDERKNGEGLLNDRLKFLFIFVSLLLAGSKYLDASLRRPAIFVGFFVSSLIWYSVYRTHFLVNRLLEMLKECHGHPYSKITKQLPKHVSFSPNTGLVVASFILVLSLLVYGCVLKPETATVPNSELEVQLRIEQNQLNELKEILQQHNSRFKQLEYSIIQLNNKVADETKPQPAINSSAPNQQLNPDGLAPAD